MLGSEGVAGALQLMPKNVSPTAGRLGIGACR